MRTYLAESTRKLDPRLKLGLAMALGPGLWMLDPALVVGFGLLLLCLLLSLTVTQPLGNRMVRSMFLFVVIWVGIKIGLDWWTGVAVKQVLLDGIELGLRLASLLMLGLCLALSSSPRALGLALSWAIRPFVGAERAWKLALSLALMVHFLPLTLSTMTSVNETLSRRCPDCGFRERMRIVPQAVLRNLGQKTWSQTLAVAGRGLENGAAWQPHFTWSLPDSCVLMAGVVILAAVTLY